MTTITVPTGKCPLDVIAELGDLKGTQIMLDSDVLKALAESADGKRFDVYKNCCTSYPIEIYFWNNSKDRPKTKLVITDQHCKEGWYRVIRIEGSVCASEPYISKREICLQMA